MWVVELGGINGDFGEEISEGCDDVVVVVAQDLACALKVTNKHKQMREKAKAIEKERKEKRGEKKKKK